MTAMAAKEGQGWTRIHKLVLLFAWLGWTFDIMDAAIFNLTKQRMVTEFLGGPAQYAARGPATEADLLMVFLIAWSIGGAFFGWLSDRFGRLKVLAWTILIYSVCTGLTAFCTEWWQLVLVRFLTGLGIGGEWSAGAAWVAESVPEKTRARAASWLQSAAAVGPVLAATANLALAHFDWRSVFIVGAFPALLLFFIRQKGFKEQAETVTREPDRPPKMEKHLWGRALAALVLGTTGIAAAQNVSFWLPNFVTSVSQGLDNAALQARQSQATYTLHVGTLIGVFLVPWLCTVLGRKRTLWLCFILSPLLVGAVFLFAKSYEALLLTAPLMSVFSIGIGAAFALYFPELFPKWLRATGAGLAYNGGRILASQFPKMTAKFIQDTKGDIALSMTLTAFVIALGGVALFFLPETKDKPLET